MKILHIINSLNAGGAEKLIIETLPLLQEQGITNDLFLLNAKNLPFEKILKTRGIVNVFSSRYKSFYNPFHVFSIIPYLKKYDMVHVHLFPAFYWVAIAKIISFSGIKLVFTEHSTANKRMNNPFYRHIDKLIYNQYCKIITISEKVDFNIKKNLKFNNKRFQLIQNGINLQDIYNALPVSKESITGIKNENRKIILQVSSFHFPKDQNTVIRALKLLPNDVIAIFAGDGALRATSENLVKNLNLSNRVFFLGVRLDTLQLLKTVDVVVLSSHHEGLSLSCLEGMASGKPFICSNVMGLKEVVDGAGLLFEDKNEIELTKHINKLLNNNDFYNEIVEKCLLKAKNYDINIMIEKQIETYKTIYNI